jgi:predicted ATPase
MLTSVTLANYRSFGPEQQIPLQPITVLVGPNNSGKSTFLEFFQHLYEWAGDAHAVLARHLHRPAVPGSLTVGLHWSDASYRAEIDPRSKAWAVDRFRHGATTVWERPVGATALKVAGAKKDPPPERTGLALALDGGTPPPLNAQALVRSLFQPLLRSRLIRLTRGALRADSPASANPELRADGDGLPSLVAYWRSLDDPRAARLDSFITTCAPEIEKILARPVDSGNRLVIRQRDGERFDASDVSDGILHLVGLAAHAVVAEPGSLLLIEEPEAAVHPRRLAQYVDLLRTIVEEYRCQVVLATHSPVLVRAFKDEPEAIVHFDRGEDGTRVRALTDMPRVLEQLQVADADPGELLTGGFLDDEDAAA